MLESLANAGALPADSPQERLHKATLTLMSLLVVVGSTVWGMMYSRLGLILPSAITFTYSIRLSASSRTASGWTTACPGRCGWMRPSPRWEPSSGHWPEGALSAMRACSVRIGTFRRANKTEPFMQLTKPDSAIF